MSPQPQGSVAEICTIAQEVDKVNQIINNCIDALKSESTSFQAGSGGVANPPGSSPPLVSDQSQTGKSGGGGGAGRGGFLSPVYKGGAYRHPIQRHHSMEAPPPMRPSSSCSSFRSDGGYHPPATPPLPSAPDSRFIEQSSPPGDSILTVTPVAAILRAEAQRMRQYQEHRHSYPGPPLGHPLDPEPDPHHQLDPPEPPPSPYGRLSPHYHSLSSGSDGSPVCTLALGLWERFKTRRRRRRHGGRHGNGAREYVAAGHALRRKVQFAKDEDLHDILDYWKGVSAQQKA